MCQIAFSEGTTNNKNLIKITVGRFVNWKHDRKTHNTNDSGWCARICRGVLVLFLAVPDPWGAAQRMLYKKNGTKLAGQGNTK